MSVDWSLIDVININWSLIDLISNTWVLNELMWLVLNNT